MNMRAVVKNNMIMYCSWFLLYALRFINTMFFETCLTYIVLWGSWCGLRGDQQESRLCTRGHHADSSCDNPGWSGSAGAGRAREVWTGTTDANEWDPRGAKQDCYHHQRLSFWLWVKKHGMQWELINMATLMFIYYLWFLDLVPKVQFREATYVGNENLGQISATVYRSGDISYKSTVRCYSRQGTAQVMMDFNERPNTDASIITFLPGCVVKLCTCPLTWLVCVCISYLPIVL